MRNRNGVHQE